MRYETILEPATAELTEKRSVFTGNIVHVQSEGQAEEYIKTVKSKYWDAKHHVFAYVLREGQIRRYSDDAEPQGTAGLPILDVLIKQGLQDVCLVVVRYFGGVLLGAGGLTRAYRSAAAQTVAAAQRVEMILGKKMYIECDYAAYQAVENLVFAFEGQIDNTKFLEKIETVILIPSERTEEFCRDLSDKTGGKIKITPRGEDFLSKKLTI